MRLYLTGYASIIMQTSSRHISSNQIHRNVKVVHINQEVRDHMVSIKSISSSVFQLFHEESPTLDIK